MFVADGGQRASKLLLVDDEADLLHNLHEWLTRSGYETHLAANGQAAALMARQHRFDVAIVDLCMPVLDGHGLLGVLKELDPRLEVIILTGQGTMRDAISALRHGRAFDFLEKPVKDLRQLNLVIEKALVRRHQTAPLEPLHLALPHESLTEREREVLVLLGRGFDNKQIADRVALSEGSLRNLLSRVYEKLGVTNRTQAALYCKGNGLVPEDS